MLTRSTYKFCVRVRNWEYEKQKELSLFRQREALIAHTVSKNNSSSIEIIAEGKGLCKLVAK